MTTWIKTKFNISDDQTNIDKYGLAANITEYHIISKLILQRIKLLWSGESFEINFNIGFGIPIEFPSQRRKKLFEMLKFIQSSFMRKLKIIESKTGHTIFNSILFKTNAARCLFKILINAMLFWYWNIFIFCYQMWIWYL